MTVAEQTREIRNNAANEIAACSDANTLQEIRVKYLGRKGLVADLFKKMGEVPAEERPAFGKQVNELKSAIDVLLNDRESGLGGGPVKDKSFDPTLPSEKFQLPNHHPITQVLNQIIDIFSSMGFGIAYGPEIESNFYNFTALNFPENHPARDMHDTFYLKEDDFLLRTHTSPVQVRVMENFKPPYKFIAPGKCYRRDTIDASHSPVFHQVEGLMVDEHISFSHLKGILNEFAKRIFNGNVTTRFRPSYFPFTEPSAEMDIMCVVCGGKGCSTCSGSGWLEILGSGMVDPEVFGFCDIDTCKWQGFAFGMGVERIAMLKYGITDMRLFYQNDLRFLEQF
jgi:phenylalanyl-tRNA synthetase alpha chain